MTKILLCGCCGKMGRVIAQLVSERRDCAIAAGVDLHGEADFPVFRDIDEVNVKADVLIDFSHPSLLQPILSYAAKQDGMAVVLCTTGYSAEQVELLKAAAAAQPVFYSRNMSLGINLLIELSKKAAKVLGSQFDIEVIEKHHNQKIDAPSGTALMIADALSEARDTDMAYMYDRHAQRKKREPNEIGLHAVRGGTIVGEHEVLFAGTQETISISHSAQSKELFAVGAVNAAVFMDGQKAGLYDMADLIS